MNISHVRRSGERSRVDILDMPLKAAPSHHENNVVFHSYRVSLKTSIVFPFPMPVNIRMCRHWECWEWLEFDMRARGWNKGIFFTVLFSTSWHIPQECRVSFWNFLKTASSQLWESHPLSLSDGQTTDGVTGSPRPNLPDCRPSNNQIRPAATFIF